MEYDADLLLLIHLHFYRKLNIYAVISTLVVNLLEANMKSKSLLTFKNAILLFI